MGVSKECLPDYRVRTHRVAAPPGQGQASVHYVCVGVEFLGRVGSVITGSVGVNVLDDEIGVHRPKLSLVAPGQCASHCVGVYPIIGGDTLVDGCNNLAAEVVEVVGFLLNPQDSHDGRG